MKSNLVPFIEAQWGSYRDKDKIKHITLKCPNKYPDAFDFVSYDISKEAKKSNSINAPNFWQNTNNRFCVIPDAVRFRTRIRRLQKYIMLSA
ncbi:hypothetical protein [Leptospira santarosai]|nr:hypothetical protein [Leptospira santarosai]